MCYSIAFACRQETAFRNVWMYQVITKETSCLYRGLVFANHWNHLTDWDDPDDLITWSIYILVASLCPNRNRASGHQSYCVCNTMFPHLDNRFCLSGLTWQGLNIVVGQYDSPHQIISPTASKSVLIDVVMHVEAISDDFSADLGLERLVILRGHVNHVGR